MPPALTELGVDKLSKADRLALAEALWESVAAELMAGAPISAELQAELERRIALAEAYPNRGVSWDRVRAAAEARWRNRSHA